MSVHNQNQDVDHLVGQLLGERYRLISPLGSGSSARVYLADDLALGRPVAVKCLRRGLGDDASFLRRFRAEATAAAQLSHPNLLSVYDWGEDDACAYLVTEVLLGGSLRDIIEHPTRLTSSQGLLVALQVAYGLDYAHQLGWVHRDIKPANLLFGPEGRLRVADFGIARAVAEASWTEPEGLLLGTARYAAPEQADPDGVDVRADLYSLVLTIAESVTGEVPLLGQSALATMMLRQGQDIGPLDALGSLGEALEPAGRADPAERPSASELVERLTSAARTLRRPDRLPLVRHDLDPSPEPSEPSGRSILEESPVLDLRVEHDPEPLVMPDVDAAVEPDPVDDSHVPAPPLDPDRPTDPGSPPHESVDLVGMEPGAATGNASSSDNGTIGRHEPVGEAPPLRRSSDQVAFEPIARPGPARPVAGDETPSVGSVQLDDRVGSLKLDDVTVIERPQVGLDPTEVTPEGRSVESEVGQSTDQRRTRRRSAARRAATSWLDEAKLDPAESSNDAVPDDAVPNDAAPNDTATSEVPAVRGAHDRHESADDLRSAARPSRLADPQRVNDSAGRAPVEEPPAPPGPDGEAKPATTGPQRRQRIVESSAPVSLSRVVEVTGLDDIKLDSAKSDNGYLDNAEVGDVSVYDAAPRFFDDYDDIDHYEIDHDDPAHEPVSSDGSNDETDVFSAVERSARPPVPGKVEPHVPAGRPVVQPTQAEDGSPDGRSGTVLHRQAARRAAVVVMGVVVALAVAVFGLRATAESEPDASAGTLGLPQSGEIAADPVAAPVGSYVGRQVEAARADAAANEWALITTKVWREDTAPGEIVEQTPLAGSLLGREGRLEVVVSQGPELISIPAVVGRSMDEAVEMLSDAGLLVGAVTEVDSEAPPGSVIATAVDGPEPATTVVESGAAVDLILSARDQANPMPSFVGLTVDQAIDQANDLGVKLEQESVASSRWELGLVADSEPPTDSPIRPGDVVTVYVSTGP